MANTILTIDMITREALRILENNLTFTKQCNREYDDQFGVTGAKIGDTLRIRKPARYTVRSGTTLSVQDQTETSTSLVLNSQKGVDISFTSKELTLNLDDFSKRVLAPAVAALANQIDRDGLALYLDIFNAVGTPGTTPASLLIYLQAGEKLDHEATPRDMDRAVVINPGAQVTIVDALKALFHSSTEIERQYEQGTMGLAAGFKWSMDQNIVTHTVGPLGGTPLVNGASQAGSSLVTDGWTAAAAARLNRGDVFTIAGVNAVNPQHRQSTGQLRQFVVTANVSSDGAGNATIPIYPAITTSGAFQTVTASPADNAALTVLGAAGTLSPQNIAFHKEAFVLGCADLVMPGGVDMASRVSSRALGLSIRMVRAYDINNDAFPCRLDVLYGWKAVYPELACRIAG
jgi:hypothetical protein